MPNTADGIPYPGPLSPVADLEQWLEDQAVATQTALDRLKLLARELTISRSQVTAPVSPNFESFYMVGTDVPARATVPSFEILNGGNANGELTLPPGLFLITATVEIGASATARSYFDLVDRGVSIAARAPIPVGEDKAHLSQTVRSDGTNRFRFEIAKTTTSPASTTVSGRTRIVRLRGL